MSATPAELDTAPDGRVVLSGLLSFATVPQLLRRGREVMDALDEVRVDLQHVERADSAGVALLVEWMREARSRGVDIVFLNIPAQMLSIARVSGLDQVLPLRRE